MRWYRLSNVTYPWLCAFRPCAFVQRDLRFVREVRFRTGGTKVVGVRFQLLAYDVPLSGQQRLRGPDAGQEALEAPPYRYGGTRYRSADARGRAQLRLDGFSPLFSG